MPPSEPDPRRTWLFGPGADTSVHEAMPSSGADALIFDLEDFAPPQRRDEARRGLKALLRHWRDSGRVTAVRINALETDGPIDLAAAMPARPDVIAYPMAESGAQMHALRAAITHWEAVLGIAAGATEIPPVCETALGVVDVRTIAGGGPRIRSAPRISPRTRAPRAIPMPLNSIMRVGDSCSSAAPPTSSRSMHPIPSAMSTAPCARLAARGGWAIAAIHRCGPSMRGR